MKQALYHALTNDVLLMALIPANKWFEQGAITDTPKPPFAVIAWGPKISVGPGLSNRTVQVWVHHHKGDFGFIDDVLLEVERVAKSLTHYEVVVGSGKSRISLMDWFRSSGELEDKDYKTNTRFAEFRVAGRDR